MTGWIKERAGGAGAPPSEEKEKGARGMPRLSEAKKDATSCEKLRGGANGHRSAGVRMGEPGRLKAGHSAARRRANAGN